MKNFIVVAVIVPLLLFAGCGKQEDFSRYPSIQIPEYSMSDYYRLLAHNNSEIAYNAICNLIKEAGPIAKKLSDESLDKTSQEYALSLKVYKKIIELLKSRDQKILAASLRFLQAFSTEFGNKKALIEPVLQARVKSANAKYEQVMALCMVATREAKISASFLKSRLNDRSWLVSRATYLLVNVLEHNPMRKELIKRYAKASSITERLLLLSGLSNNFSSRVFKFLTAEGFSVNNFQVKRAIFSMFSQAADKKSVLTWFDENYSKLNKADIVQLAETNYQTFSNEFSSFLLTIFIEKGFMPDRQFLENLNSSLKEFDSKTELSKEDKQVLNSMSRLEQALLADEVLKSAWLTIKNRPEEEIEKTINQDLKREYDLVVDEFLVKTDKILAKYDIEEDRREAYLSDLSHLKEYLVEQFGE